MRNSSRIMYTTEDSLTKIETTFDEDTVLSLDQMAELFQRDKSTISRHIKNIFEEGELSQVATVAKYATVQVEGSRTVERSIDCYNSGHITHKQAIEKVAFLSCILNVYFYFQNIGHTSLQSLRIFLYLKRQYRRKKYKNR